MHSFIEDRVHGSLHGGPTARDPSGALLTPTEHKLFTHVSPCGPQSHVLRVSPHTQAFGLSSRCAAGEL